VVKNDDEEEDDVEENDVAKDTDDDVEDKTEVFDKMDEKLVDVLLSVAGEYSAGSCCRSSWGSERSSSVPDVRSWGQISFN
jgi:hypothetical protein